MTVGRTVPVLLWFELTGDAFGAGDRLDGYSGIDGHLQRGGRHRIKVKHRSHGIEARVRRIGRRGGDAGGNRQPGTEDRTVRSGVR